ncbi:MAG: tetratricopeptide repeat protein [Bacteroidia bacterium]
MKKFRCAFFSSDLDLNDHVLCFNIALENDEQELNGEAIECYNKAIELNPTEEWHKEELIRAQAKASR